ncbi:hypothetical protein ATKI12_6530 [Kitasatospora sp. Ki12]
MDMPGIVRGTRRLTGGEPTCREQVNRHFVQAPAQSSRPGTGEKRFRASGNLRRTGGN